MPARRRDLLKQSIGLGASALIGSSAQARTPDDAAAGAAAPGPDGRGDFDFFLGQWRVAARRLRRQDKGAETWEPVTGTTRVLPILQGAGNIDEDEFQLPGATYVGGMLRLFDAATNTWRTYGLDRDSGSLQPPLAGRFHEGRGEFHGDDTEAGQPIKVRHLYFNREPTACRWEQAFSADGGKTWKTNWVIDFTRAGSAKDRG